MASTMNPAEVKRRREEKGWTHEELAEAAGLHARTVKKAERGERVARGTAGAVAGALDVPISEIGQVWQSNR